MSVAEPTPFQRARAAFHALRSPDTAKAYVTAAIEAGFPANTRAAVADELKSAGFVYEAAAVRA